MEKEDWTAEYERTARKVAMYLLSFASVYIIFVGVSWFATTIPRAYHSSWKRDGRHLKASWSVVNLTTAVRLHSLRQGWPHISLGRKIGPIQVDLKFASSHIPDNF